MVCVIAVACATVGCTTAHVLRDDAEIGILRACTPGVGREGGEAAAGEAVAAGAVAADFGRLRAALSERSIAVAAAIGALPPLHVLADDARSDRLERVEARQRFLEAVLKAALDVSSTQAEIDCEGERGDRLRDRLIELRERQLRRSALTGLIAGASTALVGGALVLAKASSAIQAGVSITGGSVEASAGAAALSAPPIGFLKTERNLLADVWERRPGSRLFRASVWHYLTDRNPRAQPFETIRDSVRAGWIASGRLGEEGSEEATRRTALLFGRGGYYTADDLQARDSILDLLEATIARMTEDLEVLMREVQALR
ncbi:MAG TPA: hypothetical protein PKA20_09990 [Burkholderiaceae bacterium]|nr:hypothetical protein [Burkholderiaceae bacterium]